MTEALKTDTAAKGWSKFALAGFLSFLLNPAAIVAILFVGEAYFRALDGYRVALIVILITNLLLVIYLVLVRQRAVGAGLVGGLVAGLLCGFVVLRAMAETFAMGFRCPLGC